jgi:hypothetical protein
VVPTEDKTNRQTVKEFASAVSTQAQVTNRTWLVLITVALLALLPQTDQTNPHLLKLPLGLGEADAKTFWTMMYGLLVVLTIAFSSAYVQQFHALSLAHRFIDAITLERQDFGGADLRQWFDILRLPTFNRVSPLAQMLQRQVQSKKTPSSRHIGPRLVSVSYYLFLKLTAMLVYFGLPAFALYRSYEQMSFVTIHRWVIYVSGTVALLGLLQAFFSDLFSLRGIVPHIWRGDSRKEI